MERPPQKLVGTGNNALTLTGNTIANTITANSGNDTLVAGTGITTMIGGSGNDTFVINSTSDVITEAVNTGNNTSVVVYGGLWPPNFEDTWLQIDDVSLIPTNG